MAQRSKRSEASRLINEAIEAVAKQGVASIDEAARVARGWRKDLLKSVKWDEAWQGEYGTSVSSRAWSVTAKNKTAALKQARALRNQFRKVAPGRQESLVGWDVVVGWGSGKHATLKWGEA